MKGFYLRRVIALLTVVAFINLSACKSSLKVNPFTAYERGLSVCFISVGTADCIFANLPDGNTLLIDTGDGLKQTYDKIKRVLDAYSVENIDYLVLTHPDADHQGNIDRLCKDFKIKRAFIPHLNNLQYFTGIYNAKNILQENGASVEYSYPLLDLSTLDYKLCFLSPCGEDNISTYYKEFNFIETPSDKDANDLSPMIYLEYLGVSFLFTGDATSRQEKRVLENYQVGVYSYLLPSVTLKDIDVLKVGHHGSKDSTCTEFLSLLSPKVAVISVGDNGVYSLPSSQLISRIRLISPSTNILRTDVNGNITINVTTQDEFSTYMQK